tara:strand:- start:546 stop:1820 length:1275 start_codon:yes stop_codon:yes gene_type:complete
MKNIKICVIGLGYIGLPLSLAFDKYFKVIGYDTNQTRVNELKKYFDRNFQCSKNVLKKKNKLKFTFDEKKIKNCNVFIITVPTPINKNKTPNLNPLKLASKKVAKYLNFNDVVIYESTVFPGVIEDYLVPILEKNSKLKFNIDFFCGYSPERLNPGSDFQDLTKIIKITSGSNIQTSKFVNNLYKKIIKAGTYNVESIKIAEAAKVIENVQRDLNIALINELHLIFNKLNLDTYKILNAAKTKWNFLNFVPGLVGGHCIGIDPYYLTYQSKKNGYDPKIILAGRKINDDMSLSLSKIFINSMKEKKLLNEHSKLLLLGFTFKENCNDIRNTKIVDIYKILKSKYDNTYIFDPIANLKEVKNTYNINLIKYPKYDYYDGILLLVSHNYFKKIGLKEIKSFIKGSGLIYDFKNFFSKGVNIKVEKK